MNWKCPGFFVERKWFKVGVDGAGRPDPGLTRADTTLVLNALEVCGVVYIAGPGVLRKLGIRA